MAGGKGGTKATIPRETGQQIKTFEKNGMQWHTYMTQGHRDIENESAQWANAVKITQQNERYQI